MDQRLINPTISLGDENSNLRQPAVRTKTGNSLRFGTGSAGIERFEAHITGQPISVHRRDVYAIGFPLCGAPGIRYRGEQLYCSPSEICVFCPDEFRAGGSATDETFVYRAVYLDPGLVREAMRGDSLPFVAKAVTSRPDLLPALRFCLTNMGEDLSDLQSVEMVVCLTRILEQIARPRTGRKELLAMPRLWRARQAITDNSAAGLSATELENIVDLDRWTIARQFRAAFGTSPSRFRTMRQLDKVRAMITTGSLLSEAALTAGFADQSHMTRMFKRTYGMTPRQWLAAQSPWSEENMHGRDFRG